MKKRTTHEKQMYAMRRASRAMDRMIVATVLADKLQAGRWAEAWGRAAGIKPARRD